MVNIDKHRYKKEGLLSKLPYIDADSYIKLTSSLDKGKEYGGSFKQKQGTNELHIDYMTGGGNSSIVLPTFYYEHHTHPSKCTSKSNCALGMPSVPDMINILSRCTEGNLCHFVFAHEGVFSVGVKSRYRKLYKENKNVHTIDKKKIRHQLNKLYNKFTNSSKMSYKSFSEIWLNEINGHDCPFKVDFFPTGKCACIPVL